MSTSSTTIPKVRTYAADLNLMRATKNVPTKIPATAAPADDVTAEQVIPPFHTFSKPEAPLPTPSSPVIKAASAPVVSDSQKAAQKILSDTSARSVGTDLKESLPAVIITDTKHKRFKLSTAIADSIQGWWADKKQTAKQRKIPKYTVPVAERRKGVIQKATAKTGRASTADHSAVLSRIKATKQIPHSVTPEVSNIAAVKTTSTAAWESEPNNQSNVVPNIIQNTRVVKRQSGGGTSTMPPLRPEVPSTPSWETDIQAKANSLVAETAAPPSKIILTGQEFSRIKQAKTEQNLNTQQSAVLGNESNSARTIKPTIPAIVPKGIVPTIPKAIPAPVEIVIPPQPKPLEAISPIPYTRPKITPTIPNIPAASVVPIATEVVPVVSQPDSLREELATQPKPAERRFAPPRETKRNIWSLFAQTNHVVFITFGIFIFVVASGLGIRALQNAPAETTEPINPVVVTAFPDSTVYSETNFVQNKAQLADRLKTSNTEVDSLVEITFLNEDGTKFAPANFFALFDATVPIDFISSLNDIKLGNYRGAPWIVLRISDKNTALGGMLSWETNMGRNLAPIFSTAPATSYARFTDSIINGTDVRIMKNGNGSEEIVYGFVGFDTLLITSNTTAFLNLAQKIY